MAAGDKSTSSDGADDKVSHTTIPEDRADDKVSRYTTIPEDRAGDPSVWVTRYLDVINAFGRGVLSDMETQRATDILAKGCKRLTGRDLEDAAESFRDPISNIVGKESILDLSEAELLEVAEAIKHIDDLRVTDDVKKKWAIAVKKVIRLQHEARSDPCKFWAYVGRDSEDGNVFKFSPIHLNFFDVWNDPDYPNSLIMAPPGHGKSTNLRGYICWRIGKDPNRRILFITDSADKASKEVRAMKRIINSSRFHALYPKIRILGRTDDEQDTGDRFTVDRPNRLSREPTLEGYGIGSRINGNGYDIVIGDDFSPEDVRNQGYLRTQITEKWTAVVEDRLRDPARSEIKVICTPWHPEDTANKIAEQVRRGHLKRWRVEIDRFRIKDDADGLAIPIWDRFPSSHFEDKKIRQGEVRYSCNYRLQARRAQSRTVRWVKYYHSLPNHRNTLEKDTFLFSALERGEKWLSIDPSASSGKDSSDHGVGRFVITEGHYGFLTRCWFLHMGPGAMEDWIVNEIMSETARPYYGVQIEAQGGIKGMVSGWIDNIKRKLRERGYPLADDIQFLSTGTHMNTGVRQNISKMQRLAESTGILESGLIRLAGVRATETAKMADWYEPIEGSEIAKLAEHILTFDGTNRSDGVDMVTQFALTHRHRLKNPSLPQDAPEKQRKSLGPLHDSLVSFLHVTGDEQSQTAYGEEERFLDERRSSWN
ncbi:MAG TPA: hypothetical protein VMZ92_21110 [Planctomycetota bacterium]|nr:hypothetical protein [Planctomycetota bacterium]